MQMSDNPYMSANDLMEMTEKQKIVEEMAQAAAEAEEALKEQVKQQEKEKLKVRNSLMMLDEEEKNIFTTNLQKKMSNDILNNQASEEKMLQARLGSIDLSLENE